MIKIYTTPSCSSCRKAKRWLEDHKVNYKEVNLFNTKITEEDINEILKNTENGFDDIISMRSKVIKEQNIDLESMSVLKLKKFIIENPSILKRPIIVDDKKIQVGYNEEDIRTFIPREFRQMFHCINCKSEEECDYCKSLKKHLGDINLNA